jgi:hypothetical protein
MHRTEPVRIQITRNSDLQTNLTLVRAQLLVPGTLKVNATISICSIYVHVHERASVCEHIKVSLLEADLH